MTDREAILARRRRFIALALAGGAATSACAPSVCLSTDVGPPRDVSVVDGGTDGGATPCLSRPPDDAGVEDAGSDDVDVGDLDAGDLDAGDLDAGDVDAGEPADSDAGKPLPCLLFAPPEPEE